MSFAQIFLKTQTQNVPIDRKFYIFWALPNTQISILLLKPYASLIFGYISKRYYTNDMVANREWLKVHLGF